MIIAPFDPIIKITRILENKNSSWTATYSQRDRHKTQKNVRDVSLKLLKLNLAN